MYSFVEKTKKLNDFKGLRTMHRVKLDAGTPLRYALQSRLSLAIEPLLRGPLEEQLTAYALEGLWRAFFRSLGSRR